MDVEHKRYRDSSPKKGSKAHLAALAAAEAASKVSKPTPEESEQDKLLRSKYGILGRQRNLES